MQKIYILGICGTAMATIAILLKEKGLEVVGSDTGIFPPMSDLLKKYQIPVHESFTEDHIIQSGADLFVIGNAITRNNLELEYILDHKLPYCSGAEALRRFFLWESRNIIVTGTHGKTTTTSMLAYIFNYAPDSPGASFFIGGLMENFQTSAAYHPHAPYFILEGDEYDTAFFDKRSKFIHYLPETVIINNLEFDHADIFTSLPEIQKCFHHLVRIIPRNGLVIYNGDEPHIQPALKEVHCPALTFGTQSHHDLVVEYHGINPQGLTVGSFHYQNRTYPVSLQVLGEHNLMNAAGAFLAAQHYRIPVPAILQALSRFKGARRRLSKIWEGAHKVLYDDFAHHPTAISKTLATLHQLYPDYQIILCQEFSNNTSYRNIHQKAYIHAFSPARTVLFKLHPRYYRLPETEKLKLDELTHDLADQGIQASFFANTSDLFQTLIPLIHPRQKQVILVGGSATFDGLLHQLKTYLTHTFHGKE
ncbi:MAG: hypothetical protein KBA26_12920 [Candidatus Delongbacteria bacterium]|nr:hypothetical protein [Candidatus Delongbacteria bacterium]